MTLAKWQMLYNLREIRMQNGVFKSKPLQSFSTAMANNAPIILVRYCPDQPVDPIPANRFWTEFITDDPQLASAGTGIFLNEAKWRIEWSFPAAQAVNLTTVGEKRASPTNTGWYTEYTNNFPVPLNSCKITQL